MKFIYLVIFSLFLLSCATMKESNNLFDNYSAYTNKIKKNNSKFILPMLSSNKKNKIKSLGEAQFPVLSEFPKILYRIESHYQKIEKKKGCLTVNGYGVNNKPIIISVKYLHENSEWVIDFIEVYYADSAKEFQEIGVCPSEI